MAPERTMLANLRSVASRCIGLVLTAGDQAVIRWVFEFEWLDGRASRMEQPAYQR